MTDKETSPEILSLCAKVTGKRPRIVIDHILKNGHVTTYELESLYGYRHAPRAARDVRESGVPLETFKTTHEGKTIAAYRFGDPKSIKKGRISGRKAFSKQFKNLLISKCGSKDAFTGETLEARYLQIDHRIPYEIAGEHSHDEHDPGAYMLIDSSGQRAKSWSCEQCPNWQTKEPSMCESCFWAFPEKYTHIAGEQIRRIDIEWRGTHEVNAFEKLRQKADLENLSVAAFLKKISSK